MLACLNINEEYQMNIKNLMKLAAILSMCASASVGAAINAEKLEDKYRFEGDVQYASFCKAILTNDVSLLKRSIRREVGDIGSNEKSVVRILLSDHGVKCDGENLVEFSIQRDAPNVYAYFKK